MDESEGQTRYISALKDMKSSTFALVQYPAISNLIKTYLIMAVTHLVIPPAVNAWGGSLCCPFFLSFRLSGLPLLLSLLSCSLFALTNDTIDLCQPLLKLFLFC